MRVRRGGARAAVLPAILAMVGAIAATSGRAADDLTIIGGHSYRFPSAVFQGGVVERGRVASLLLQVAWPNMEGFRLADMLRTDAPESLLILGLSNANGNPYTPAELDTAEKQAIKVAVSEYGTPGFPLHAAAPGAASGPVPGGGMIMVEAHPDGGQGTDVFVSPSIEAPTEVISCNKPDPVFTNPQCHQQWVSRGMLLKVSYKRPMVGQWREIGASLERFFAAHEVVP